MTDWGCDGHVVWATVVRAGGIVPPPNITPGGIRPPLPGAPGGPGGPGAKAMHADSDLASS